MVEVGWWERVGQHQWWRSALSRGNVDAIACAVVVAVCFDFVTTANIFLDPALSEGNEFLSTLAAVHVSLALAANLGYGVALVGTYVFVGGWLGRVAAATAFPSALLGVNNLLYALEGDPSLLDVAFGDALHAAIAYGIPAFGFVVGLSWHLARERTLPWRRVAATAVVAAATFALLAAVV